jgi:hypothetical protein
MQLYLLMFMHCFNRRRTEVRVEFFMVMKIQGTAFCVVTPCSDVALSSEMLVSHHITQWHYNSENHNQELYLLLQGLKERLP